MASLLILAEKMGKSSELSQFIGPVNKPTQSPKGQVGGSNPLWDANKIKSLQ